MDDDKPEYLHGVPHQLQSISKTAEMLKNISFSLHKTKLKALLRADKRALTYCMK